MKDCHVHTNISHDGISTFKHYISAAKQKGVDEITFTGNWDGYAKNFDLAFDILENIGFDEVAIYHSRIPDFEKIKRLKKW